MSADWRMILGGAAVVSGMLLFMTVVIAVAAKLADKAIRYAEARDDEEARQIEAAVAAHDQ